MLRYILKLSNKHFLLMIYNFSSMLKKLPSKSLILKIEHVQSSLKSKTPLQMGKNLWFTQAKTIAFDVSPRVSKRSIFADHVSIILRSKYLNPWCISLKESLTDYNDNLYLVLDKTINKYLTHNHVIGRSLLVQLIFLIIKLI
jgi:hypothetical protein